MFNCRNYDHHDEHYHRDHDGHFHHFRRRRHRVTHVQLSTEAKEQELSAEYEKIQNGRKS